MPGGFLCSVEMSKKSKRSFPNNSRQQLFFYQFRNNVSKQLIFPETTTVWSCERHWTGAKFPFVSDNIHPRDQSSHHPGPNATLTWKNSSYTYAMHDCSLQNHSLKQKNSYKLQSLKIHSEQKNLKNLHFGQSLRVTGSHTMDSWTRRMSSATMSAEFRYSFFSQKLPNAWFSFTGVNGLCLFLYCHLIESHAALCGYRWYRSQHSIFWPLVRS